MMAGRAAALLALSLASPACKSSPAAQRPASAEVKVQNVVGVAEAKRRLELLRAETIVERSRHVTTASNVASYESSLRKYEREAVEVRLYERVPLSPEEGKLGSDLERALSPLGLSPVNVVVAERKGTRRSLPKTIPEGERFQPMPGDVRGILDVSFEVPGAKRAQLETLLTKLGAMVRLFYTTRAVPSAAGLRFEGEAYHFFPDFEVPVMLPRTRELDLLLGERGIEPGKLRGDAEAQALLDELAVDYRAMAEKKHDYARALALQGRLVRFDAWMRFARDRAVEAAQRAVKDVSIR